MIAQKVVNNYLKFQSCYLSRDTPEFMPADIDASSILAAFGDLLAYTFVVYWVKFGCKFEE